MSVDKDNQTYKKTSFLTGVNSDYIEEYYALYLQNPKLLTKDWIEFFDGLKLKNAYITTALKCVPPGDKPEINELNNCSNFFNQEINNLKNLCVIVALGKIAFDTCIYFYKRNYNLNEKFIFGHGQIYTLPNNIKLVGCYHPSPRNVNTGRINLIKMSKLFRKVLNLI